MQDLLFVLGLGLFLLGLITGLVIPVLKNPRMGVSGHMVGMTNGPFLIVVGLLRKFAPGAAGDHRASAAEEKVVDLLLVTLAPVMVAATVLLIVGVLR